jgi:hypothetical protein
MAKIYLVDLESLPSRYTCEWRIYFPLLLKKQGHNVTVISGPSDIPNATTPGAFLNFGGTNIYKSVQTEQISRLFCAGTINPGDHFIFADAWHPGIINLKYMSELLDIPIKIHALFHAGSYDPADFLGRIIGNKPWIRHAEKSFFHAIDYNYFATNFHIEMFIRNLLNDGLAENPWIDEEVEHALNGKCPNIVRTGWPMEYMEETLAPYTKLKKRDLILFPHRIAAEKQIEIFLDLKQHLPQYEFVVCQDQRLSKHEYHTLLGQAKIIFSANLQETLGISTCSEGPLAQAIPLVPDRLSYSEIFKGHQEFLYPSNWTEYLDQYYLNSNNLVNRIVHTMENYETLLPVVNDYIKTAYPNYFTAQVMLNNFN